MTAGYIEKQEENIPRPEVIEHEGKKLHRLPKRELPTSCASTVVRAARSAVQRLSSAWSAWSGASYSPKKGGRPSKLRKMPK